jgi:hypothetical protein
VPVETKLGGYSMFRRMLIGAAAAVFAATGLGAAAGTAQAAPNVSAAPPAATAAARIQVQPFMCVTGYVCAYLGTDGDLGGTGFFTSDTNWNVGPFAVGNRTHSAWNTGDPNDALNWVTLHSLTGFRDASGFPPRCLGNYFLDGIGASFAPNLGVLQPESNNWHQHGAC